jgi:acetoacetyl-CoA synthetase
MARYMDWLSEEKGLAFPDYAREGYERLWEWSVREVEEFWASVWDYCGVIHSRPYERVLESRAMPVGESQWFPGARLNYAENVLGGAGNIQRPDDPALIHASETRSLDNVGTVTRGELREKVAATASALRGLGVGKGDRVVAYLPNIPETIVAFLATASVGAIWSSCSPDFGAPAVIERFAQIEPKVLFACDGYRYGGKDFDRTETVAELEREIPSLEHTVLLPYLSDSPDVSGLSDTLTLWDELLSGHEGAEPHFEQVPFDHPLWVLYSSGTTGLPKAIVQGHGGILLEHLKKVYLHMDLSEEDRFFWFTTTGWMMWNLLVSGLLGGGAIVLYDGSPGQPDMDAMWRLAEEAGITVFGTSAGYLTACMKAGIEPARDHDLSGLRAIGSTGSPLPPEGFEWVYGHVKEDLHLFSTSGGTDVCTAFIGGSPLLPVRAGELQCRALGASVHAFDEEGLPLIDDVGELVITVPMPSMPLYLWNDPGGEKYHESYFEHYSGVWRHGDWLKVKHTGACVIYGRSDSTINRGGVRMGTAEIYSAVESVEGVADSLVVDVPVGDGTETRIYLFVVPEEGSELGEDLTAEIKRGVREHCSPRHVPDDLLVIEEVPRTLNGKKLEVPVKKILSGKPLEEAASRDSLANPEALDYFAGLGVSRD